MSLTPFILTSRSADPFLSDPFFRDSWQIFDPFRDEHFAGRRSGHGGEADLTRQLSPLLTSDLVETEKEFKVLADLPGVNPQDLELSIEGSTLLMKAERKHTHENKTDKYHSLERSYGKVQRRIKLPKNADLTNASTRFKDGVLTVTIPKVAEQPAAPTKLTINCE
eukprot:GDKJ01019108.1.p1 GENE.GDKJ01019108.1~~GDKJ01019108.1.p1  ORF type:complete len:166 (+),score=26.45 GDKJ01019108.1:93-590(+)